MKLDGSIIILIEHSEHERGELARVSVGEELRVDFDEASLREQPVRTILQESFVPLFNLLFREICLRYKLVHCFLF